MINVAQLLNETIISKLLIKYKNIKHVYMGFIYKDGTSRTKLVKSITRSIVRDSIPCIIIPARINTAVITMDMIAQFIENTKYSIWHLVIVNRHGILLLSTTSRLHLGKLQSVYKDAAFITRFFKSNHDYKKIKRVIQVKYFNLLKID